MAYQPINPVKRGPGRPRKDEQGDVGERNRAPDKQVDAGPIGRLQDVPGQEPARDDRHVLGPAPEDPNQDRPLPATAKAVVSVPTVGQAKSEDPKKVEDENARINRQREKAARAFAVKDAPLAQAALDAEDDPKAMSPTPVIVNKGYFPLDGGEKLQPGTLTTMPRAVAKKAQELGHVTIAVDELP